MDDSVPSRMEVNAAIEALIRNPEAQEWQQHASTILRFAKTLRKNGMRKFRASHTAGGEPETHAGHTDEMGNVSVETESDGSRRKSVSLGVHVERVGHYKLERECDGNVVFYSFWKSDETTRGIGGEPVRYQIHPGDDGEAECFGVWEQECLWRLSLIVFTVTRYDEYVRILSGRGRGERRDSKRCYYFA